MMLRMRPYIPSSSRPAPASDHVFSDLPSTDSPHPAAAVVAAHRCDLRSHPFAALPLLWQHACLLPSSTADPLPLGCVCSPELPSPPLLSSPSFRIWARHALLACLLFACLIAHLPALRPADLVAPCQFISLLHPPPWATFPTLNRQRIPCVRHRRTSLAPRILRGSFSTSTVFHVCCCAPLHARSKSTLEQYAWFPGLDGPAFIL